MMQRIALLAPVPQEHLYSGLDTIAAEGKVAFGSLAWEVFRKLDEHRGDEYVDVYIYASDSGKYGAPKVRWRACYLGHVDGVNGSHPDGMTFRPASTVINASDNTGHWAVFWEVDQLVELEKADAIPMMSFKGFQSNKCFVPSYIPRGPMLVQQL